MDGKTFETIFCSFTDQPFKSGTNSDENSAILITNPMDAKFVYGHDIEHTLETMRNSTHIRVLGSKKLHSLFLHQFYIVFFFESKG